MSSPLTGDSEELMCCRDTVVLSSAAVGTPDPLAAAANIYLDLYHEGIIK